tara:strand:+ start:813 stop:941 length:129 start_codon:yes stop_codon:yes gene_type:complete
MDEIEEKAKKLKAIRFTLFQDDWAIHHLINCYERLQCRDEDK